MDVPNNSLMPVVPDLEAVGTTPRAYFQSLGRRIKRLRHECELSQGDLADALDVSQQTVCAFEGGNRRVQIHQIPVLMRTFQITAEQLLGLQPLPPPVASPVSARHLRHVEALKLLSAADQETIFRLTALMRP